MSQRSRSGALSRSSPAILEARSADEDSDSEEATRSGTGEGSSLPSSWEGDEAGQGEGLASLGPHFGGVFAPSLPCAELSGACQRESDDSAAAIKAPLVQTPNRDQGMAPGRRFGREVRLHIYDIWSLAQRFGLPVFHLGVEVYKREFYFSAFGIRTCKPGQHRFYNLRETVPLGNTGLSASEVQQLVRSLRRSWRHDTYRALGHNCQTFAFEFAALLGVAEVPEAYLLFSGRWLRSGMRCGECGQSSCVPEGCFIAHGFPHTGHFPPAGHTARSDAEWDKDGVVDISDIVVVESA